MDTRDTLNRTLWTFVQSFLGFVTADALVNLNAGYWKVALASSVASALVVVKEYAKARTGSP